MVSLNRKLASFQRFNVYIHVHVMFICMSYTNIDNTLCQCLYTCHIQDCVSMSIYTYIYIIYKLWPGDTITTQYYVTLQWDQDNDVTLTGMRANNIDVVLVRVVTSRRDELAFELVLQFNSISLTGRPSGGVTRNVFYSGSVR